MRWMLALSMLSLGLCACGGDDAGEPQPAPDGGKRSDLPEPEVRAEVVPFPFTSVLTDEASRLLTEVSEDGATLRFTGEHAELDALEADRILVLPRTTLTPYGLLRRIDAVERDGDALVLTTRETSFLFAFEKVDIEVRAGAPDDASALPPFPTALSVQSAGSYPFTHDVDWVVFDGDKKASTTEDRVLVSGELQAYVGYDFRLSFDWGALGDIIDCIEDGGLDCIDALNPLSIASGIDLSLTFAADLGAGADLKVSGASALSFEREIELGPPVYLPYIQAGPIGLTPRFVATAGVRGSATGTIDVDVEVSGGVELGIKASGSGVSPIGKGPYLDTPSGSATLQKSALARAWVSPRVELLIYGFVGPSIGLVPYAEVTADTDQDPCFRLEGGLDAALGIHLSAGPVTLISETRSVPIEAAEITSGECELPDGIAGGSLDPTFEPWAEVISGMLHSSGSLGAQTALAFTHDGNVLFSASSADGLLKVDQQGEPLWGRTYVRDTIETLYAERAVSLADASILIVGRRGAVLRVDEIGALLEASVLDIADHRNTRIGAIARTEEGGAWAVGDTPGADDAVDGWLARFEPDGSLKDAFRIVGALDERPQAIVLLEDGGALIAGTAREGGNSRGFALRLDAEGQAMYFVRLVDCVPPLPGLGENGIAIEAATLTQDGNFVLAGYTTYPEFRGLLTKLEADGSAAFWARAYSAELLGLRFSALASLESGGFLVGGTRVAINADDALMLGETDSAGSFAWMHRYDGPGRDGHASILRTPEDNGVLLAGMSEELLEEDAAFVLKLPRKNGELSFEGTTDTVRETFEAGDVEGCIELEPYAGALVEQVDATLVPLADVTDEPLELERVTP